MAVGKPAAATLRRVKKVQSQGGPEPATEAAPPREIHIGTEFDVLGSIYIDAHVRLDGTIDGEIRCQELEVSKIGRIRGIIVAERVTVYGTVADGRIYASVLILRPGCSVEAEIYHEHLQLEQGSYFDGKSRRVSDPASLAPA